MCKAEHFWVNLSPGLAVGRPLTPDLKSVGADTIVSIIGFSGHQVTDVCEATAVTRQLRC